MNQAQSRTLLAWGAAGVTLWAASRWWRSRDTFRGKTVVITGGSRGLGLEMARLWTAEGANVAICARTEEDLARAQQELVRRGGSVLAQSVDITSQEQVDQFIHTVVGRFGAIDVLVNNAGIIQAGPVDCMTLADYEMAMRTHFWGPLFAISAVLPHMRRQGQGRIVNVTSIGGKISVPHLVPYSASKFALVGLSQGLSAELAPHGIHVTTVCPGLMRTGSPRNAEFKGRHRAEYAWFSISDSLPGITISSQHAARAIIEACRRKETEVVLSLPAAAAARIHGVFPGITVRALGLINRLLPSPGGIGTQSRKGSESFSQFSPSWLTVLTEKAAVANNEIRSNGLAVDR
jgi:NAD(P)-dependent dehydrogenase (short-subunit alcohol dehydrogenase family)